MFINEKSRRIHVLALVVIAVFIVLIIRIGWLQIFQGPLYKRIADENRIRDIPQQAPRGTMYDRNGAVLVTNRPSFAVSIIPGEYVNTDQTTDVLTYILGISPDSIDLMLRRVKNYPYTPIRLKRNVDDATIAKIEERKDYLPGVIIEAIPVRYYVYEQLAAQVFGYVGIISEDEYSERKDKGYLPSDLIGKDGLERVWEDVLRGVDGGNQVEINALGEEIRNIGARKAIPGNAIVLTIDGNLQKLAEDVIKEQVEISKKQGQPAKGGAIVVIDVKTGGILVMANIPSYDPNLFAGGISTNEWAKLMNDERRPLTNRAIQNGYPPGSVFKIVTASAALESGLTTADEIFEDKGFYVLNGWTFYGWETKGLGKLKIIDALAWSSDPVFYELGRRLGIDMLADYALTFGFGKKTGIRLIGEENGVVPTQDWKLETYDQPWYPGETLIAAIGQGYYLSTPLQQAMLLMAVANGGIMYRPILVDKVISPDGKIISKFEPEVNRMVYLRPDVWDTVRKGLTAVTTSGTASGIFQGFKYTVAGKTGSAETGRGTTHSWFACYAPVDAPQIALVAFVEEGGEGSQAATPIARKVLEAYFTGNFTK